MKTLTAIIYWSSYSEQPSIIPVQVFAVEKISCKKRLFQRSQPVRSRAPSRYTKNLFSKFSPPTIQVPKVGSTKKVFSSTFGREGNFCSAKLAVSLRQSLKNVLLSLAIYIWRSSKDPLHDFSHDTFLLKPAPVTSYLGLLEHVTGIYKEMRGSIQFFGGKLPFTIK